MKLLTDEQLFDARLNELKFEFIWAQTEKLKAAKKNQWQRHKQLGEYLHKIEQLITEKQ
jgi:hypothetical protein